MSGSWRIGRIAGIDVYIHFTFLLLLGWVAISHYLAHGDLAEAMSGLVFILALFGGVVGVHGAGRGGRWPCGQRGAGSGHLFRVGPRTWTSVA